MSWLLMSFHVLLAIIPCVETVMIINSCPIMGGMLLISAQRPICLTGKVSGLQLPQSSGNLNLSSGISITRLLIVCLSKFAGLIVWAPASASTSPMIPKCPASTDCFKCSLTCSTWVCYLLTAYRCIEKISTACRIASFDCALSAGNFLFPLHSAAFLIGQSGTVAFTVHYSLCSCFFHLFPIFSAF